MQTEEERVRNEELACLVDDVVFKGSLLRVYQKAIEDIRALCVSSMYWKNDEYPNCARILAHHHKIVTDAQVKIAELTAIEYGDEMKIYHSRLGGPGHQNAKEGCMMGRIFNPQEPREEKEITLPARA